MKKNLKAHEKTSSSHLAKVGISTPISASQTCSICSKCFSKKSGLKRHLLAQHGIEDLSTEFASSPRLPLSSVSTPVNKYEHVIECGSTTDATRPTISVHDILIFMPAYANNNRKTQSRSDDTYSPDRNCFALVLLGVALTKAVGLKGNVQMLIPRALPMEDFYDAATHLELTSEFAAICSNVVTFQNETDMVEQFSSFAKKSATSSLRSLFVYGHGDATRIKIIFNGSLNNLSAAQLANMISTSGCDVAHIMTCKASKLVTSMAGTKRAKGTLLNGKVLFFGYGNDDITTVPFQFAEGLIFCFWHYITPNPDSITVNTVHINAGCIAFLTACSANASGSLKNVIESVQIPNHAGNVVTKQEVLVFSRFYMEVALPHPLLNSELVILFPEIQELITFLDSFGINQADYHEALEMLSHQKDLLFE